MRSLKAMWSSMLPLLLAVTMAGCCAYGSSGGGTQEVWVASAGNSASSTPQEARRDCTRACNCHGAAMEQCMVDRGYRKERQDMPRSCRPASLF